MNKLYIGNQLVDLTDDVDISWTYEATELDTPTAEKNSFSKSVEIPGTKNNNAIFGEFWRLDRNTLDSDTLSIGTNFDPRHRVDFVLWNNGNIVESGYVQLDEVTIEKNEITYSVTLYGGLGDFFYGLMYDEEGEDKTLADLYYGFLDSDGNKLSEEAEESAVLFQWDKDFIMSGWTSLMNGTFGQTMQPCDQIVAAPTYSGTYDDFDNAKVLINYDNLTTSAKRFISTSAHTEGSGDDKKTYTPINGWILAEASRDLDEHEVRDLRSEYQRPAIKFNMILDAISNKDQNGGYEVDWDEEIVNSRYWTHTYIMMNRLQFDDNDDINVDTNLETTTTSSSNMLGNWAGGTDYRNIVLHKEYFDTETTYDTSAMLKPRAELNIKTNLFIQSYDPQMFTSYYQTIYNYDPVKNKTTKTYTNVVGGLMFRLDCYVDGVLNCSTPNYLYTSTQGNPYFDGWETALAEKYHIDVNTIVRTETEFTKTSTVSSGSTYQMTETDMPHLQLDLPQASGVTLKLASYYVVVGSGDNPNSRFQFGYKDTSDLKGYYSQFNWYCDISFMTDDDDNYINAIYDNMSSKLQPSSVNKDILFAETSTPYDYLISFAKALGLKFESDVAQKKIYIRLRKNFYKNEIINLDDKIDRSQTIKITPTLTEYKWYLYGFETPETYADKLYSNKVDKLGYGNFKVDTGYYFNDETNELYDECVFTNAIPYKLKSVYFNKITDLPDIVISPTLELTYWCRSDEYSTWNTTIYGYSHYANLPDNAADKLQKLCCFDDGDGNVDDVTNCLVFYDGWFETPTYQLTDNLAIMRQLNDGNSCFLWDDTTYGIADRSTTAVAQRISYQIDALPIFSKYVESGGTYIDSLDFKKPEYSFVGDSGMYKDGITLYDRYWKDYITDLYDKNNKKVTLYCWLEDTPQNALKKFYYFDNSLWLLNTITDYDPDSNEPTECDFIKVKDIKNYIQVD